MKQFGFLLAFLCSQILFSQNISDLSLKNVELPGMKPATVNAELRQMGITENPFVTTDKQLISRIENKNSSDFIRKLYMFLYNHPKNGDGGVVICEFSDKKDLEAYLAETFDQSNYRVLVKGLFVIRVWSDYHLHVKGKETSEDHLNKLEKYYTILGATKVKLEEDESIITSVSE